MTHLRDPSTHSPDRLGPRHIREYQAQLFTVRKLTPGSVTNHLCALRFLYIQTLKRPWSIADTPYQPGRVQRRSAGQNCKPPASLELANGSKPSAQLAGAWFTKHGNLSCAVSAFFSGRCKKVAAIRAMPTATWGTAFVATQQVVAGGEEFRLALRYKPEMKMAHGSLGAVLMDRGETANAETEFRQALRLDLQLAPVQHCREAGLARLSNLLPRLLSTTQVGHPGDAQNGWSRFSPSHILPVKPATG